jgi:AcrR family transcriptional regulator
VGTRERIVGAAYGIVAEKGLEVTTTKEIARVAGVAPALIYYYFEDKDRLLLEVLREASERYGRQGRRTDDHLLVSGGGAPMSRNGSEPRAGSLLEVWLAEMRGRTVGQPGWYRLLYELFPLGLRDPRFSPGIAELLRSRRRGLAGALRGVVGRELPNEEAHAAVLLACLDGLALQKMVDPGFDLDAAHQALARTLETTARMEAR